MTRNALHPVEELGFRPTARGTWEREGVRLELERRWWILRAPAGGPARPALGDPGLWREIRGERVFECPAPEDTEQITRIVGWALATERGATDPGWRAPPRAEIEGRIAPRDLLVSAGSRTSQGRILRGESRLALSFVLAASIPAGLGGARRRWLEACLLDAGLWRMARAGVDPEDGAVRAEIDLSGAPAELLEPLLAGSLGALRFLVGWILPAVDLVLDSGVAFRALDLPPMRALPAGRIPSP